MQNAIQNLINKLTTKEDIKFSPQKSLSPSPNKRLKSISNQLQYIEQKPQIKKKKKYKKISKNKNSFFLSHRSNAIANDRNYSSKLTLTSNKM